VFQRNCMSYADDGSARAPVHLLIGHAGAPYSWAISPETPPYYEVVAIQHGYLRVEANRTALLMEVLLRMHQLHMTAISVQCATLQASLGLTRLQTVAGRHHGWLP
jgi:hypothetical protein